MKKIPCLFVRDFSTKPFTITREVAPGCEWVLEGRGTPTRKRDGTSCMFQGGKLYKRYDVKKGRAVPEGAIPCELEPDAKTGHWPHWVEVGTGPEDKWHVEALSGLRASDGGRFRDRAMLGEGQTYELVGPRINGNPERLEEHHFLQHGSELLFDVPRNFDALREFLRTMPFEGIVWWDLGDRVGQRDAEEPKLCKLRRDDFGFDWPIKA
jgi:hypothetical protein